MEQLGDGELVSFFKAINNKDDTFTCTKPLSNRYLQLLANWCPKLHYLYLRLEPNVDPDEPDFDDDGLCAVANAGRNLYVVKLRRRLHVSDVGIVSLVRSSKNLGRLDLCQCVNVTDESLKAIENASLLGNLNLLGCKQITDLGLKYLASGDLRNSLEELTLAECDKISDEGVVFLKQMVRLTNLDLSKCGDNITDYGGYAISKIPNMEILDLSWLTNITDCTVNSVATNYWKLSELYLTGCEKLTSSSLTAFENHRTLELLEMFTPDDTTWEDVESVAMSCRKLKSLTLSNRFNDSDYHVINNCFVRRLEMINDETSILCVNQ